MSLVLGFLAIVAIVILVIVLAALAIQAIVRDRGQHGTSGSLSAAMLNVQSLLEPEKRHVVEQKEAEEESEDEDRIAGP